MFYSYFLYGLLLGYLKNVPLKNGGGQMGMSTYALGGGVVASVNVSMMEEGVKFLPLCCVCTN